MNRSRVNLGNGAVKKTGVRKKMAGGGMVKKTGVRKFRGGGMVKKTGVKKRMRAGGMVKKPGKDQVGLKKLPKEVGKAGKKLFDKQKRKGRPPKTKTAKIKSRVNLGAGDAVSAAAYTAGGYALGASGKDKKKKKNA